MWEIFLQASCRENLYNLQVCFPSSQFWRHIFSRETLFTRHGHISNRNIHWKICKYRLHPEIRNTSISAMILPHLFGLDNRDEGKARCTGITQNQSLDSSLRLTSRNRLLRSHWEKFLNRNSLCIICMYSIPIS